MTLNPAVEALLGMMAQMPAVDFETATAADARTIFDNPIPGGEPIPMARVEDISIALPGRTLDARLYVPRGASETPGLTVFFHGGGWVIGTLDTHDGTCRALAKTSHAAVLSVAYRLAPEYRYPTAAQDCFDATAWAAANATQLGIDPNRLAVAGDSAGGNLAAAVAIMARDAGAPKLVHQLLIYPVTDVDFDRPSYAANGAGDYYLSTVGMKWFWDHYLGSVSPDEAPLAVVLGQANLSGLAPATVITAEYDPLRDEGDAYAAKLTAAGVAVDGVCAPGMIHGFFSMFEMIPDAMPWIERGGKNLAKAFA
ncbi:MAG: alpha/beta hydrolase [Sphingomonadaceae bacterium]